VKQAEAENVINKKPAPLFSVLSEVASVQVAISPLSTNPRF
jgi:hypothetical protein